MMKIGANFQQLRQRIHKDGPMNTCSTKLYHLIHVKTWFRMRCNLKFKEKFDVTINKTVFAKIMAKGKELSVVGTIASSSLSAGPHSLIIPSILP